MHQIQSVARNLSALQSDEDSELYPNAEVILCLTSPRYTPTGRDSETTTIRFNAGAKTLRDFAKQLNTIADEVDTLQARLVLEAR